MELVDYSKLPRLITQEERKHAQETFQQIVELNNEGWQQKDIAPEVGLSASWVSRIIKRIRKEQEALGMLETQEAAHNVLAMAQAIQSDADAVLAEQAHQDAEAERVLANQPTNGELPEDANV